MQAKIWMRRVVLGSLVVAVGFGCSNEPDEPTDTGAGDTGLADVADAADDTGGEDTGADDGADAVDDSGTDAQSDTGAIDLKRNCDPLNTGRCALPWPSNLYLAKDAERTTGYTLTFGPEALPATRTGQHVEPTPWQRLDGYGVGSAAMVAFENLDASGLPDQNQVADSLAEDAKALFYEVGEDGSLTKIPWWAELDQKADEDAALKTLYVRPAVILKEDTRYIVALRNLKRQNGDPVPAPEAFAKLRAGETSDNPQLAARQARFDEIFAKLKDEGVTPDSLTLAWDFHTASSDALHGSMLHMRDRGKEIVGEDGPEITFDSVTAYAKPGEAEGEQKTNPNIAFEIEGTFRVPRFVSYEMLRGRQGWIFNRGEDGLPAQDGWKESPFWLTIPHSAVADTAADATPHGLIKYGHGLLGTGEQVEGGFNDRIANTHNYIFFGANLYGMSSEDAISALHALSDLSRFPFMADRLHQGMMEYLLLMQGMRGRLEGLLATHEKTKDANITIDTSKSFYSGISQGGIFGGTFMALAQDVPRGHLGVPGNNYSLLLDRSVDFDQYFKVLAQNYPNRIDQTIAIQLIQLLWEQTDPVSYLRHIKEEPFPNTPAHDIILAPAKGDYQVSPMSNVIAARSDIGLKLMEGYGNEVDLLEEQSYPHDGSGVVLYDFGNPWPQPGNTPPKDDIGDPHESPRRVDPHNRQMIHFFETGEIIEVCTEYTPDRMRKCPQMTP